MYLRTMMVMKLITGIVILVVHVVVRDSDLHDR